MGFLKKLFSSGASSPTSDFYAFNVRCDRCGEMIEGRINLANDLSTDDEGGYLVRKVLMGSERCFQQIEVILHYDSARYLKEQEIHGGKFVE